MQLAYVFLGYFLGSMLFGYRITWLLKGVDIRKLAEDENPGTYNAFVFGGFWCGILTLLADMGKGYLRCLDMPSQFFTEEKVERELQFLLGYCWRCFQSGNRCFCWRFFISYFRWFLRSVHIADVQL